MGQHLYTKKFALSSGILIALISILSFWIVHGEPIHDINVWYMEKSFYTQHIKHPSNSILLGKKKYLGGPSMHGDSRCVYAVGETRSAPLSKEEIKRAYLDQSIGFWTRRLPLNVLFVDEYNGPRELPFVMWQDELPYIFASTTLYVVYVSGQRDIILYDLRCDD